MVDLCILLPSPAVPTIVSVLVLCLTTNRCFVFVLVHLRPNSFELYYFCVVQSVKICGMSRFNWCLHTYHYIYVHHKL